MFQQNSGSGGFGSFQNTKASNRGGGFGSYNNSQHNNGYSSNRGGRGGGYNKRRHNNYRGGGGGGYRGGRGRGRGGYRGRGRGRGGGLKLATDVAQFSGALDAHKSTGGGPTGVTSVAIWTEGQKLFSGGADGVVKMFDFNGTMITEQQEGQAIGTLCFANGWLFVGFLGPGAPGQQVGFVKGFNFNKQPVDTVNFAMNEQFPAAHHAQVNGICVCGDMVITASLDKSVKAWKYNPAGNTWALVGNYGGQQTAHDHGVISAASVHDKVFSGSESGEVKLWDAANGSQLNALNAHNGPVSAIAGWEAKGMSVLLTCGADSTVKVWDLASITSPQVQPIFVYQTRRPKPFASFFPSTLGDGRNVLFCGFEDGSIQLFDLPDFSDLGFLDGHRRNNCITSLVHTNGLLFAGSMDGNLNCFSIA